MTTDSVSVENFIADYTRKYIDGLSLKVKKENIRLPVVTIAMEPGSGGSIIAEKVAEQLGFDWFHREIVEKIEGSNRFAPALDQRRCTVRRPLGVSASAATVAPLCVEPNVGSQPDRLFCAGSIGTGRFHAVSRS